MPRHILQRLRSLPVYGLLLVWLFLAGVALAEQVDLLIETSTQDEQALSALVLAIKPGVTNADGHITIVGPALTSIAPALSSLLLFGVISDKPPSHLLSRASLPLFLALSCYRV